MLTRRHIIAAALFPLAAGLARAQPITTRAERLVAAARAQIGVTLTYDPAYSRLDYPMGDVPRDRGVCTDVVIRAYRDALGVDLQQLVHEDMAAHFSKYPKNWGLSRTDRNIDHRRVPNLKTFFTRAGSSLKTDATFSHINPGDLLTMTVPHNLPHIAIASDARSADGLRPLIIHNIGAGAREEDRMSEFAQTGRYRFLLDDST
jgi:uncharacterized protein YijF (DUF1287 family)